MPLGKISSTMIKEAYKILKRLEDVLNSLESTSNDSRDLQILTLTNQFYTV